MGFSSDQLEAVHAAFHLAGFHDELRTLPIDIESDRVFIVGSTKEATMGDTHDLELVLSQVLGLRVLVTEDVGAPTVAFP